MTFLQTRNEAPLWLFSFFSNLHHDDFSPRTKLRHHYDFSHFLGPKLQRQFLGWKNALIPQLIDSDGRALHKDSESGPNSKITKITNMTFLQNTADFTRCEGSLPTSITFHASQSFTVYVLCVCSVDTLHILLSAVSQASATATACPHSHTLFSQVRVSLFSLENSFGESGWL